MRRPLTEQRKNLTGSHRLESLVLRPPVGQSCARCGSACNPSSFGREDS